MVTRGVIWQVCGQCFPKCDIMLCMRFMYAGLGSGLFFIGYSFAMIPSQYVLMQVRGTLQQLISRSSSLMCHKTDAAE